MSPESSHLKWLWRPTEANQWEASDLLWMLTGTIKCPKKH